MVGNSRAEGMKGSGKAGREEAAPNGEGGDSKYIEYTEPPMSLHLPSFLSLLFTKGRVHDTV